MKIQFIYFAVFFSLPCCLLCGCGSGPKVEATFHQGPGVRALAFSPNGKLLAAGGNRVSEKTSDHWEGKLAVWDIASGKEVKSVELPAWVNSVSFSLDGKLLVAGVGTLESGQHADFLGLKDKSGEILIYDTEKFQQITKIEENNGVHSVKFSSDGKFLAAASFKAWEPLDPFGGGAVKVWEVGTWKEIFSVPNINDAMPGIAFHPRQNQLAVSDATKKGEGGSPGKIKVFEIATQKCLNEFSVQKGNGFFIKFSPNGKTIFVASPSDYPKFWDWETSKDVTPPGFAKELKWDFPLISPSPDGKILACVDRRPNSTTKKRAIGSTFGIWKRTRFAPNGTGRTQATQ